MHFGIMDIFFLTSFIVFEMWIDYELFPSFMFFCDKSFT